MMKKTGFNIIGWLLIVSTWSCLTTTDKPGYTYCPDMDEPVSLQAFQPYVPDEDALPILFVPADHTIPREQVPYEFGKSRKDRVIVGTQFGEIGLDSFDVRKGRGHYMNYCAMCHGNKGDGKGHMVVTGLYPYRSSSLLTPEIQNGASGEIYHVITVGWRMMGPHGSMLSPEERWELVAYIKSLGE